MSEAKKGRGPRRKFTREFKADVVKLCRSGNEPIGEVAKRLDLTETAVRAWVKQAEVDAGRGDVTAPTTDEKAEMARLRRELKRVTEERDILKKATVDSMGRRNVIERKAIVKKRRVRPGDVRPILGSLGRPPGRRREHLASFWTSIRAGHRVSKPRRTRGFHRLSETVGFVRMVGCHQTSFRRSQVDI